MSEGLVDLGGCEGCGLGCAVACADGSTDTAAEARRVLVATGAAVVLLAAVPAIIASYGWLRLLAAGVALGGLLIGGLATAALEIGRPGGDRVARWGYRAVPAAVAGLLVVWAATLVVALVG